MNKLKLSMLIVVFTIITVVFSIPTFAATGSYDGPAVVGVKHTPMHSRADATVSWQYMGPYIANYQYANEPYDYGLKNYPTIIDYNTNKHVYAATNYVIAKTAIGYDKNWEAFEYNYIAGELYESIGNTNTYLTYEPLQAANEFLPGGRFSGGGNIGFRINPSTNIKQITKHNTYATDLYSVEVDYRAQKWLGEKYGGSQLCIGTQMVCNTNTNSNTGIGGSLSRIWSGNNIIGMGGAPYPDLAIQSITPNKLEYLEGETITVTVVVVNNSNNTNGYNSRPINEYPPGGRPNEIGFEFRNLGGGVIDSQTQYMEGIAKNGGTSQYTFTVVAPSVTVPTQFNFWTMADMRRPNETDEFSLKYGNNVEINENNNTATSLSNITINPSNNLTMVSITTNKPSYEAEESGTVTAVVKNSGGNPLSNIPVSLTVNPANSFLITNPNVDIPYLASGESTNITWDIKSGAYELDITGAFSATVDPNNVILETNENDNSKTCYSDAYRLKPDLIVESVLTNKEPDKVFEAGETISITATIRNIGKANAGANTVRLSQLAPDSMQQEGFDQTQEPPLNPNFDVNIEELAPNNITTITWKFINPIRIEARKVDATVTADINNIVQELREDNNVNTIKLTLNPGKADFTPEFFNVTDNQTLKGGYEAIISVKVRNIGKISSDGVKVKLMLNGVAYEDNIDIPTAIPNFPTGYHPAGSNLALFRVALPKNDGKYNLEVTADPNNTVEEEREDNNTAKIKIIIEQEITPQVKEVTDGDLEQEYVKNGIATVPNIPCKDTAIWEEIRKTGAKTYELRVFNAKMTQEFILKPAGYIKKTTKPMEIESGFGLEGESTIKVTTNYDRPQFLIGAQIVRTYYPETQYGNKAPYTNYHEKLISYGGTDFSKRWIMQKNPTSAKGYAVHYTPKWYPDKQYTGICYALYGFAPTGMISSTAVNGNVQIIGDMYDRVSTVSH